MINIEWFEDHLETTLTILPPSISDHALLPLNGEENKTSKKRKFKFLNSATDVEGYEKSISTNWKEPLRGKPMFVLWKKLQRL